MTSRVLSLVLIFVCLGCSTTLQLTTLEDVKRKVGGKSATILLRSGKVYDAERIDMTEDATRFIDADNDSMTAIPTKEIETFRLTQRGGGALEGFLFGSLGGFSIGLVAGDRGAGMAGIYGGILGGIGGVIVGGLKGHTYTFIVPMDSTAP
jgi:hypothetical protein